MVSHYTGHAPSRRRRAMLDAISSSLRSVIWFQPRGDGMVAALMDLSALAECVEASALLMQPPAAQLLARYPSSKYNDLMGVINAMVC